MCTKLSSLIPFIGIPKGKCCDPNLAEQLDDFLSIKKPGYAVMVTGEWGVGKTYAIREYFKNKKSICIWKSPVFVSLYGVKDEAMLEIELLKASFTLGWGCLYMLILGGLFYLFYLISKVLHCIIGGDNISFLTFWIPLLFSLLFSLYKILKNKLFHYFIMRPVVFDDFERAKMPPEELLSYIYRFVEQSNKHVIIICNENEVNCMNTDEKNESEIDNNEGQVSADNNTPNTSKDNAYEHNHTENIRYEKMEEKVIGKKITVTQDKNTVLQNLFEKMELPILSKIIPYQLSFKDFIERTTPQGIETNYRLWAQCCYEFESSFKKIQADIITNKIVWERLLPTFLAFSYIRKNKILMQLGNFSFNDFREVFEIHPLLAISKTTDIYSNLKEKNTNNYLKIFYIFPYAQIKNKKSFPEIIPASVFKLLFYDNIVDEKILNEYFKTQVGQNNEAWYQLYFFSDNSDKENIDNLSRIFQEINETKQIKPNYFIMIYSIISKMMAQNYIPYSLINLERKKHNKHNKFLNSDNFVLFSQISHNFSRI